MGIDLGYFGNFRRGKNSLSKDAALLPDGSLSSLNSFETRLNNNGIILATSGGGKTRSVVIPNILAAFWSYVISDPKGTLYKHYSRYLRQCGYNIVHLVSSDLRI